MIVRIADDLETRTGVSGAGFLVHPGRTYRAESVRAMTKGAGLCNDRRECSLMCYSRDKLLVLLVFFLSLACDRAPNPSTESVPLAAVPAKFASMREKLVPFFDPMGKPGPYDWLRDHKEAGQTLDEYLNGSPTLPTPERRTIYVQPLGKFTRDESQVVRDTAAFMEAFFGIPVKVLPGASFDPNLPDHAFRYVGRDPNRQIRTGYIMQELLIPKLPADAAALIAFTNEDLFPDESMNFVFGQASLVERVGVWSMNRLHDKRDPRKLLLRTLKVGVHETGHMFSIQHCTKYVCVFSGSNNLEETDWQPLDACPECAAKACWITDCDPAERFAKLAKLTRKFGLSDEAELFERKRVAVADQ